MTTNKESSLSLSSLNAVEVASKKRQSDDITDPNFLTYLSSCIKEVHTSDNEDFKTFAQRIKDSELPRDALSKDEKDEVNLFLEGMKNVDDIADLHSSLGSAAGFKSLLKVKSAAQLLAYCSILNINESDFEYIFNEKNEPHTSLTKLSLVMSLGIWYFTMKEQEFKGVVLKPETKDLMSRIYAIVGGTNAEGECVSDSFDSGLNFARRILSGVQVERKRGRRPKNYFSQYDKGLIES